MAPVVSVVAVCGRTWVQRHLQAMSRRLPDQRFVSSLSVPERKVSARYIFESLITGISFCSGSSGISCRSCLSSLALWHAPLTLHWSSNSDTLFVTLCPACVSRRPAAWSGPHRAAPLGHFRRVLVSWPRAARKSSVDCRWAVCLVF